MKQLSFPVKFLFQDFDRFTEECQIPNELNTFKSLGNLFNKILGNYSKDEVHIKSSILQALSPLNKWSTIRNWLKDNGYLHVTPFTRNKETFGLVLTKAFTTSITLAHGRDIAIEQSKIDHPSHVEMIDFIVECQENSIFDTEVKIEFDKETLRELIQFITTRNIDSKNYKKFQLFRKKLEDKDISFLLDGHNFKNKWFFKVDSYSGRVHSPVTNMKKVFRHFLRSKSRKLTEIDIRNSQPLFLANILSQQEGDHSKFISDSSEGSLYQNIANHVKLTRDEVKAQIMFILFKTKGNNVQANLKKSKDQRTLITDHRKSIILGFKEMYPDTWDWLENQKFTKEDVNEFCKRLQILEVNFVFDKVIPVFKSNDIKYMTIHDSFIVERHQEDKVKRILVKEMKKLLVPGAVKMERL